MKKQLYRAAAATILGLSLTTGIVAADTGTIHDTGKDSSNAITTTATNSSSVMNDNEVAGENVNVQEGVSGDAKANDNTNGGDAKTGAVMNDNSLTAKVSVDNSDSSTMPSMPLVTGMGGGTIGNTGNSSTNDVTTTLTNSSTVTNTNSVQFENVNVQAGQSGDAHASGNTNGGSAISGGVTNTNSSEFNFSVTN